MTDNQVQRVLKTEGLYQKILDMICDNVFDKHGETYVRGHLDALLSQGKIEGRLTGIAHEADPHDDRLVQDWQRIVDGV